MKIQDFNEVELEVDHNEIVKILKGVYEGNVYAEYVGGTLTYSYTNPETKKKHLLVFNVDRYWSEEINKWICKLYIQNKNEKCTYWDRAQIILHNIKERRES